MSLLLLFNQASNAGAAAGTATVAAVSSATKTAAGASAGVATVAGIGASSNGSVSATGSAAGVATVAAVSSATATASGLSAGLSTVSGIGASTGGTPVVDTSGQTNLTKGGHRGPGSRSFTRKQFEEIVAEARARAAEIQNKKAKKALVQAVNEASEIEVDNHDQIGVLSRALKSATEAKSPVTVVKQARIAIDAAKALKEYNDALNDEDEEIFLLAA